MSKGKDALVLVTGATGFVAHHVIQLLQREGYRVRGTVRSLKNENRLKSVRNLCPDAKHPIELVEADLTKDDGWIAAVKDCDYCMHVASPFPNAPPKNDDDLIIPAVEGTKRVLRACADSGSIKRVILTSSIAAVHGQTESDKNTVYNEDEWTDVSSPYTDTYAKSKTLAEKAAWEFVHSLPQERKMELAVINPSVILGPCISGVVCTSLEYIKRLMDWSTPLVPLMHVSFCDVRDVALAHLRAMTKPEAVNKRHLIVSDHLWMQEIARVLHKEFSPQGYCIPTYRAPYIGLYFFSFFDKSARLVLPRYGKEYNYANNRMKEVLKVEPLDAESVILDTAYSLIECGILHKTSRYKTRNGKSS